MILEKRERIFAVFSVLLPSVGSVVAILLFFMNGLHPVNFLVFVILYWLTLVGVEIGFHRLGSHHAFKTSKTLQAIFYILGSMAFQGPLLFWIGVHKHHHQHADQSEDFHSPHINRKGPFSLWQGMYHATIGWLFRYPSCAWLLAVKKQLKNNSIVFIHKFYLLWIAIGLFLPALIGGLVTQSIYGGLEGLLWGGFVRIAGVQFAIYSVNWAGHGWGSRPFNTPDRSTNTVWLLPFTFGVNWHNNHHAFPRASSYWFTWWQWDLYAVIIFILERLGLVWDVMRPSPKAMHHKLQKSKLANLINQESA